MNPRQCYAVRVSVQTPSTSIEYIVHVVNRSKHALTGALRAARRKYTEATSIEARFVQPRAVRSVLPRLEASYT